jgi:hypothetical protein
MNLNDVTPERVAAVGLGVYVALAGLTTIVGMPWQYLNGGILLAALRAVGALLATVGGAAVVWATVRA